MIVPLAVLLIIITKVLLLKGVAIAIELIVIGVVPITSIIIKLVTLIYTILVLLLLVITKLPLVPETLTIAYSLT